MTSLVNAVLRLVDALPRPLRKPLAALISERSPLYRLYLRVLGEGKRPIPPPTPLPVGDRRVYIAPVNAAEQARRWATALPATLPRTGAAFMVAPTRRGIVFERDAPVPLGAYHLSKQWQQAEFEQVSRFTHVLVEAERSMFGGLFRYDVEREIDALRARGVSVALVSHGSDTRNPETNMRSTAWSPFHERPAETTQLIEESARNRTLIERLGVPTFVVTPEMLDDLPRAHWCPNVADFDRWATAARPLLSEPKPVAVHLPSNGWMKGTELITPALTRLAEDGCLALQPSTFVPQDAMPTVIGKVDIVLEQFRMGFYSTTAVESLAAGRVVVAHVLPTVRSFIREQTGLEVPVVEATPDTLEDVLRELTGKPDRLREIGQKGQEFAKIVHDGTLSAKVLAEHWLDLN